MSDVITPDAPAADAGMAGAPPPPAPDAGQLPPTGQQLPTQPPPGGGAQPPAVSPHAGVFDQFLKLLGGGPKKTYSVDPSGKMVEQDAPYSRKDAILSSIAGALTGLAAGSQVRGPGAALRSAGAGFGAEQQQLQEGDLAKRQQAQQDFERQRQTQRDQQDQQLKAAQTYETNQRAILTTRQAENTEEDIKRKYVEDSGPVIEGAREQTVNGVSPLKREHLTQNQLLQEHSQDGARHATSNIYLPDGLAPMMDPKTGEAMKDAEGNPRMEYTFAELDPHASVELSSDMLDQAVKNGYPVPGHVAGAGSMTMPVKAAADLVHYNQGVANFGNLTNDINKTLGLKGGAALDPQTLIQDHPALGPALSKLASHWDGQPSTLEKALTSMQAPNKDGKTPDAPYAKTIVQALGGNTLEDYNAKTAGHLKTEAETDERIDSRDKALAVQSDPKETPARKQQAAKFLAGEQNQALLTSEAHATAQEGARAARTSGSAINPKTGVREEVNQKFAQDSGWAGFEEMKPQARELEKDATRQLGVVQADHSGYMAAAQRAQQNPLTTDDKVRLHDLLNKAGVYDADASIAGGHVTLPMVSSLAEGLSRAQKTDSYDKLSPAARDLYDNYTRALSAVPVYQKAIAKTGRANKEMMDLELANIANPTIDPALILNKGKLFQRNLDIAAQGRVHFPDIESPSDIRQHMEGPQNQAPVPQTNPNDPFAAFGGKAR